MTRYAITDSATIAAVGLPKYMIGTWVHYNTNLGFVRLGRVSGRGAKFASLLEADFAKMVQVGLAVAL